MVEKNKNYRWKNIFMLVSSMRVYALEMLLTILAGLSKHLIMIWTSLIVAYMVGLAMEGQLEDQFTKLFMLLCLGIVLRAVMFYGEMWFGHDVAYRVLKDFRVRLYDQIDKISPAYLISQRSGQIGSTLMSDVELLEWFLAHTLGSYVVAAGVMIIILVVLVQINILLAGLMLIFVVLTVWSSFFMRNKADEQGKAVRERLSDANAVTVEGIQGLRELLTLNYLEPYKEKNKAEMKKLYDAQVIYGKRLGTESMLMQIFVGTFTVIVMGITALLVKGGSLAFSYYPVVVMLSALLFNPIIEICGVSRNFGLIFAAANRVGQVFNTEPMVKDAGKAVNIHILDYSVNFEQVAFSYQADLENTLKGVSFNIKEGETVALVGPSGAGKTTCCNLLLRYWDVQGGSISIGGTDIRDIALDNLQDMVSAVLQDVYLFHTSVKENIRLGKLDATDEEIETAAKVAFAHDFIKGLPNGYDAITGERGFRLSGGQRQRIAIARAVLKNTPILILDEAVSSLDTENEQFIQKALKDQAGKRTTIVVAHRLSTIMAADKLVVINDGRVVQVGSHHELIKKEGFYKDLVADQFDKG